MRTKLLKIMTVAILGLGAWVGQAHAYAYHKVLCEVDQYSVRVLAEVPDGNLKYIVFNYQTNNTTIVPNGDYSASSTYHYYDFILHGPPQDTIVEVASLKSNSNVVWLRVWEYGSLIYNKKCTFGKRIVTY